MAKLCKCGCGESIRGKRVFVNKEHQLAWMYAGGARELNAMLSEDVRIRGGKTAGQISVVSGRLAAASAIGAARTREITERFRQTLAERDASGS